MNDSSVTPYLIAESRYTNTKGKSFVLFLFPSQYHFWATDSTPLAPFGKGGTQKFAHQ